MINPDERKDNMMRLPDMQWIDVSLMMGYISMGIYYGTSEDM
jgi:hypothetical protein